jgi:hypothetical protein
MALLVLSYKIKSRKFLHAPCIYNFNIYIYFKICLSLSYAGLEKDEYFTIWGRNMDTKYTTGEQITGNWDGFLEKIC